MTPFDRGSQCLLPWVRIAAALEQVEALRQPRKHLTRGQHPRPSGGELDGEWEPVESPAQLLNVRAWFVLRALAEKKDAICLGERW